MDGEYAHRAAMILPVGNRRHIWICPVLQGTRTCLETDALDSLGRAKEMGEGTELLREVRRWRLREWRAGCSILLNI